MDNIKEPALDQGQTPFNNIALAFSGGGFRAASFGLGVLSYLNELKQINDIPLLNQVSFISSASGGTMANAMYALNNAQGKDFGTFYRKLYENLEGTGLLDEVFKILNDDSQWEIRPDKTRNLINAFALAYDDLLFDGNPLGTLYQPNSPSHLDEVCFNATEFYKGLLFRQNIKMKFDSEFGKDNGYRFGNFNVNLNYSASSKLKIADLMAASSCFPAGFEPIIFPDDFTYNSHRDPPQIVHDGLDKQMLLDNLWVGLQQLNKSELNMLYGEKKVEQIIASLPPGQGVEELKQVFNKQNLADDFQIGMMDGGITDNQALESILDAQQRRTDKQTSFQPFDLMLVNDVGSNFMDPYVLPKNQSPYTGLKGLTINNLIVIFTILAVAGAGGILNSIFGGSGNTDNVIITIVSSLVLFLSVGVLGIIAFISNSIKNNIDKIDGLNLNRNFSKTIVGNLFGHFGATPVLVIVRMISERIRSILILNSDVFLKRIRFLLYNDAYQSGKYKFRIKANHVYDLAFSNDLNRADNDIATIIPSRPMQIVAQSAFEMATTLWFDKTNQDSNRLAALIACGQFTTCYNLLVYIYRLKNTKRSNGTTYYATLSQPYKEKVDHLENELNNDFSKFRNDPFFMYNKMGVEFGINNFKITTIAEFPFPDAEFGGLR